MDLEPGVPTVLYIGRRSRVIGRATGFTDCFLSLLQQNDPRYPLDTLV
jgi:hypothetical protein